MSDLNFEGLSDNQLRLFAVRCARRVQHLMTDPRSIAALDVAERYANGQATDDELSAARNAASAAAEDAAEAAASAATWVAAEVVEVARDAELAEQQKILDEIRQEQPR